MKLYRKLSFLAILREIYVEIKRAGLALSKSRYLCGLQCPKLLWLRYNAPEEVPPPDKSSLDIFEQGHLVGDFAKRFFQMESKLIIADHLNMD